MSSSVRLFGNVQFTWEGKPVTAINAHRLRSLLALLVLRADVPQSREQLASLLWPDSEEGQARTNLRQLLHHFRRALPPTCSLLNSESDKLYSGIAVPIALWTSMTLTGFSNRRGRRRAGPIRRGSVSNSSRPRSLSGRSGPGIIRRVAYVFPRPLPAAVCDVLCRLALLCEQAGDYEAGIRHAERLVAQDPLREAHHQLIIRLHSANHDGRPRYVHTISACALCGGSWEWIRIR